MACSPEQNVKTKEIKAYPFHDSLFNLYKYRLNNPVNEIRISRGKKDQFQAMIMRLL
ncbi:hypothetical protein PMEGAPL103_11380 [Priestia megaterium]